MRVLVLPASFIVFLCLSRSLAIFLSDCDSPTTLVLQAVRFAKLLKWIYAICDSQCIAKNLVTFLQVLCSTLKNKQFAALLSFN